MNDFFSPYVLLRLCFYYIITMTPNKPIVPSPICLFDYTDYRRFLEDYIQEKKTENSHFSFRYIADRLDLRSSGFILYVIQGKRRLSEELTFKICQFFKFTKKETEYFLLLVKYAHTKSFVEKQFYFDRLAAMRRVTVRCIEPQKYRYYEKWYYLAIREYVAIHRFVDQYEKLARDLTPSITPAQAAEAIHTLEELGLIRKNEQDFYERVEAVTSTGDAWQSATVHNLQQQLLDISKDALARLPKKKRDFSNLTLSMSRRTFDEARIRIEQLRAELLELARRDENPDGIYQISIQAFPLHDDFSKGGNI